MFFKDNASGRVVLASQWFKNGDHPFDGCMMLRHHLGASFASEGELVGFCREEGTCPLCGASLADHGMLRDDSKVKVCPGDWVVSYDGGGFVGVTSAPPSTIAVKPDEFEANYSMTGDAG